MFKDCVSNTCRNGDEGNFLRLAIRGLNFVCVLSDGHHREFIVAERNVP